MKLRLMILLLAALSPVVINAQINKDAEMITLLLKENGNFLNNPKLPVLIYKNVFDFSGAADPASIIEKRLAENNWGDSWRNGIYSFHHYHSTAHEALGVYGGWAEVQLGGPDSETLKIEKGDLVVLPAGTAHKKISSGDGFAVVGAYPDGQNWDMNYGKSDELKVAKENIKKVRRPNYDPIFRENGKIFDYWK